MKNEDYVQIGYNGFAVAILPATGGKIASIRMGDHEMLQQPLIEYMKRSREMPFDSSDASGWDECLPSVAACEVMLAAGPVTIPDHGDLWRIPWEVLAADESACTMRALCFSLPIELSRIVTVDRVDGGFTIRLDYCLRNIGATPAPWAWSAHPLFIVAAGDRILLPESVQSVRVEASCSGRWREAVVKWPIATTCDGSATDLSIVHAPEAQIGDKLFAGPLTESANWCALERISLGLRIRVSFDAAATPFLGLWLCYGGWPACPGPKQMCVALEPSTIPVDSLASAGNGQRVLQPGASESWTMAVEFRRV